MDEIIKIIEAVGNQWEFLLVAVFGIFLFTFKKYIALLFPRIKKLKLAGQEVELENRIDSFTQNSIQAPQADDNPVAEADATADNNTFENLFICYERKDEEGAKKTLSAIQEAEIDPLKKEKNRISDLFIRYVTNFDSNAVKELQNVLDELDNEEIKAYGYCRLGLCLQISRNFDKAIIAFRKAESLGRDQIFIAESIVQQSSCLIEEGQKIESLNCLLEGLKKVSNNDAKSILYKGLATFYKKGDNSLMASLAYEKALKLSPDNQELLFDTAYQFSKANVRLLSLLHYKTLISLSPNHSAALNNLGVCFGELGMKFKQKSNYKEAIKKGNNLAAGNLAINFIDAGFYDEAKKILDKAKLVDNPEPKVTSALSRLTNEIIDETEKEEKLMEIAKIEQRLFINLPDEIFLQYLDKIDLNGKWKEKDGNEIILTHNENSIKIEWLSEEENYRKRYISGNFKSKLIAEVKYYVTPFSYSPYDVYNGYGVLYNNFTKFHFIFFKENNYEILEFEFSKL
ncbi:hypothetical protein ACFLRT_05995 [Acidobacteriota bacterium]